MNTLTSCYFITTHKHDQVGAMVAMFQIREGGLAEVSKLTHSHWEQNWDVNEQPRPLAVCCPSVLPDWPASQR